MLYTCIDFVILSHTSKHERVVFLFSINKIQLYNLKNSPFVGCTFVNAKYSQVFHLHIYRGVQYHI